MLKATRTRLGSPAWLAVGLVFFVPALAEAQLFPNRTIRREKPDCATEPPFYKQVRRDYFGYYPTCWSRFPDGWGCPCPDTELQTMRTEFKPDINRKAPNGDDKFIDKDKPMDDADPAVKDKPADPGLPPIPPGGASPFEMDPKPAVPPGTGGAPPRGTSSNIPGSNLTPSTPASAMELPPIPGTSPTISNDAPVRPGGIVMYPDDATLTSAVANDRPNLGPLPAAPLPAASTPDVSTGFVSASTPTSNGAETVLGNPRPAQAPKRQSLLGRLLGRNNTTTQNR